MHWFRRLALRAAKAWRREDREKDLDRELRAHLDLEAAEQEDAGLPPDEARYAARRAFGNTTSVKEDTRAMWGWTSVEGLAQDLRYGVRQFRRNPGFIGANTAIFSVINGVILRPLAYQDPERLVTLDERAQPVGGWWSFSYPNFLDCERESHSFESMAAWRNEGANLTAPGQPEFVRTRQISAGFFSVLGIQPALGRTFLVQEDQPGAAPVAVVSHSVWEKRFGADPQVVGARLVLQGKPYTVVGVLPAGFRFLGDPAVYTPIGQNGEINMSRRDTHPGIGVIARLKQGTAFGQARSELAVIGHRLAKQYPDTNGDRTFGMKPLKEDLVGDVGPTLYLLAGAVGLVLLIAGANVGNLVLARSLSRSREFAIRAALGAGRGRVMRQVLTESTLLGLAGGLAGLLIASFGTRSMLTHLPGGLPRLSEVSFDARVLLFTLCASLFTGILFGLAPALRQRLDLEEALKQGARGNTRGLRRLQSSFVVAEVALAFVLLVGSGLMLRTILRLWSVNPGFDPHHVVVMGVGLSPKVVNDPVLIRAAWEQVLQGVQSIPGVQSAAVNSLVPLRGDESHIQYWTGSTPPPPNKIPMALVYTPTPDYWNTLRIPLLRGRFFSERDRLGAEPVVIIDERLAARAFPDRDPVGSKLSLQFLGPARIVGVVGHVKHRTLDEDARAGGNEQVYIPFEQIPDPFMRLPPTGMELLVRTSANPLSIIQAVKQSVLGPGRDQPVYGMQTMEQTIGDSLGLRRLMLLLLGTFAAVALLLASVGIYGVISYSTNQRVQEIGIRLALGASRKDVLKLVVKQGLALTVIALVLGLFAALALTHFLTGMLYGVRPTDPATYVIVCLALAGVALLASYIPARRATKVDPMVALRYE